MPQNVSQKFDPTTPALPRLQRFLTYRLSTLTAKLNRQATAVLARASGLTLPEWRVVALLTAHGEMNGAQLADLSSIDRGQISRTLYDLEQRDLVASRRSNEDRRNVLVKLTRKGRSMHDKTLPHMQARQQHLLGALTAQERDVVLRIIDKLDVAAGATSFDGERA